MAILENLEKFIVSVTTLRDDGVPSVSMALMENSTITSHVISNGKENSSTIYQAASISKAITALAVAKLVSDGKISYDDKVVDWIPKSRLEALGKTEPWMDHVTVSALVSHRSGLSQWGFPGYASADRLPTEEDIFQGRPPANTPRIRFDSPPFAEMRYSGGGFILLQVLLEYVTGSPFATLMRDIVLEPLGMTRSSFADPAHDDDNYARAFATSQAPASFAPPHCGYHHHLPDASAAGLWSTPTDLLRAVVGVQQSLDREGGYLSRDTARKMLTAVEPNKASFAMALGWCADDTVFAHQGGNDPGYNAYVFGFHGGSVNRASSSSMTEGEGGKGRESVHTNSPLGTGFAIMSNSRVGFPTMQRIIGAVFYLQGWAIPPRLPCSLSTLDFVPYRAPDDVKIKEGWKAWAGKWENGWTLENEDESPKLKLPKIATPLRLFPGAFPLIQEGGRECQTLVVEGCRVGVRLAFVDSEEKLQVIQIDGVSTFRRA